MWKIPGNARPDRAAAHTKNIHVVVFHTLLGRKMVVDEGGAHTLHLVRTDRSAYATSADGDPTFDFARNDGVGQAEEHSPG